MKTIKLPVPAAMIIALSSVFIFSCQKNIHEPTLRSEEALAMSANNHANALPHTKQYPANVATAWYKLLTDVAKTSRYSPGPSSRIFAYSGIALYESVVPGMPSYQSMYKHLTGNTIQVDHKKDYYWPACANAAIARIASRLMQNYPAPNLSSLQALEATLNASFQSAATPAQLQLSNEFGQYVADIIYDWSKTDGTLNPNGTLAACPAYVPLGGPGNWAPTPPGFFPAVGGCTGDIRTFIPNIVNTVVTPAHPSYSTDHASAFYQATNEVFQRRNNVTPEQTLFVNNWRDILGTNYNPPTHVLRIMTYIVVKEKLNLEDAAVLFAKQTMATSDAIAAAFKSKFQYALIRPISYIHGVMGQTTWNSTFNTMQHPSHPDELSSTASTVEILEGFFGTNYAFTDSTHKALYGEWLHPSFNGFLNSVVESRLNSGTNFRFSGEAGIVQGRAVGQMTNALPFKKP